jgi:exodeoxyribonuclease-1
VRDTFYFYDLETTGRDPRWHRVLQFAGVRTSADLEPLEEPVSWLVAPDDDVVPEPEAMLVTGLVPDDWAGGIDERELFRRVAAEFARPGTCVVGYNNLRFDDEFVRHGLWRNLFDPYAREWQGGNSRWDLIDLVRMAAALRPDGIVWPEEDGRRVFRLEALAAANDIEQVRAHDAVSDVLATLGLARRLREAQPKLFDWYLSLRDKRRVADLVLPRLSTPFVHVSGRYGAVRNHVAIAAAVAAHPVNRNSVVVADLSVDPDLWSGASADELRSLLYTPAAELGDRVRPPLKELHLNKVPAIAPLAVLGTADADRLGLDAARCEANLERLRATAGLEARIAEVFAPRERAPEADVEGGLYDGFLPDADRDVLVGLRDADAAALAAPPPIADARARELVFRQLARRFPDALDADGRERWAAHVRDRLGAGRPGGGGRGMPSIPEALGRIEALRAEGADPGVLDPLEGWLREQARRWSVPVA